jgi:hypothetical protein
MTDSRIKAGLLWTAMVVAVLLGLLWQLFPLPDAGDRLAALPENGLMMASEDLPLTEAEERIYAEAQVLKRLVQVRGQRVILTIIDGTRNRHAVHDPLFCFRGAGWDVVDSAPFPLEWGQAQQVDLRKRGETAEALYWFTDGQRAFDRSLTYWWRTTLRRVTLGASGDEPVLVVLSPAGDRPIRWDRLLAEWPEIGAF